MRKIVLLFLFFFCVANARATSYFISPTGSDSNSGLSSGTPWLSPNHAVNCGDTITAAASSSYSETNFQAGKWGTVTCAGNNNVAWLQCATFDACKITTSTNASGMQIGKSYWGVQGWEISASSGTLAGCIQVRPPGGVTIHHIVIANNVCNGAENGGITAFDASTTASFDYVAIVGNAIYNSANATNVCDSGISVYQPIKSDSVVGTHIYITGNFSWANINPNPCNGSTPTDGEGIIVDTMDFSQGGGTAYNQQVVVYNNIVVGNGGRGIEEFNNSAGASNATVVIYQNTSWSNSRDANQIFPPCGEIQIVVAKNTTVRNNVAQTTASNCLGGTNNVYPYLMENGDSSNSVHDNVAKSASGTNTFLNNSDGFSYGSNPLFGTDPGFSSPSVPGAPSCSGKTSVVNCMSAMITTFTATGVAAGFGYVTPSTTSIVDPLFPAWLCNVNLPSGLVTPGCGVPAGPGTGLINFTTSGTLHNPGGNSMPTAPINVRLGNLLLCNVRQSTGAVLSSITDTAGNTFHLTPRVSATSQNEDVGYAWNTIAMNGDIVNFNFVSNPGISTVGICLQFAGITNTSDPLDANVGVGQAPVSAITSPTFTTTQTDELLYAGLSGSGTNLQWLAGTCGTALCTIGPPAGNSGQAIAVEYSEVLATQTNQTISASVSGTQPSPQSAIIDVLTFKVTPGAGSPIVIPGSAGLIEGGTQQFSVLANSPGSWSVSGTDVNGNPVAAKGSINSGTGLYTAPASIVAGASLGGYQIFPSNHVYNTRIDSLPVNSNSTTWLAGSGTAAFTFYQMEMPVNYINNSTPSGPVVFATAPAHSGTFQTPIYPAARAQGGWLAALQDRNGDHHVLTINTDTGELTDRYLWYALCTTTAASVTANVATLTCAQNPLQAGFVVGGKPIGIGGFTGADTFFNVGPVSLTAVTSTTISYSLIHANASASTNGSASYNYLCVTCNSQDGAIYESGSYNLTGGSSSDAAGLFVTPLILREQEFAQAVATSGSINHAVRFTLQNSHICASSTGSCGSPVGTRHIWPAQAEAFLGSGIVPYGARYRLKAAFNCGTLSANAQILCTLLKNYGMILSDGGTDMAATAEVTKWPIALANAIYEISYANITPNNFEAVDESSLMIDNSSGDTIGNREIVTFTRTSDGQITTVDVALNGIAVGVPYDLKQIQVGAPAQQFSAFVQGDANTSVTWTMSPTVGTLTSGGLYTPPGSVGSPTITTVTATSAANSSVAASFQLIVYPAGPIRMVPGSVPGVNNFVMVPTNYTDSLSNVWYPNGDDGGYAATGPPPTITGTPDPTLYKYEYASYLQAGNDLRFDFIVPNGNYTITYKVASTFGTTGSQVFDLEINGAVVYPNFDPFVFAGGSNVAADYVTTTTVTNNQLSFVQRTLAINGTHLGALSFAQNVPAGVSSLQGGTLRGGTLK